MAHGPQLFGGGLGMFPGNSFFYFKLMN
jgi:hypothetical protein